MHPVTSNKGAASRPSIWISLVAMVVLCAVGLLWLLRAPPRPAARARVQAAVHGSYQNRAVFRPLAEKKAPGEPAEPLAIRGRIYTTDGDPIPGAAVVATTFDIAGNMPSTAGSTRADAKGAFAIPLAAGTYILSAAMPGYAPSGTAAQSGDTVSLVMAKSGVIQGHVLDERGRPVQRFTIDIVSVGPADAPATPPAWSKSFESLDGAYRADQIPTWPVLVRAVTEDHAPGISPPVSVHAGDTRDVDITVGEGCTLSGTVQDKSGTPLPGVLVNAEERLSAGSAMDPTLQTSTQTQSGDDGTFTLEHVPRATVVVRGYDGSSAVTTVTVQASDCAKIPKVALTMLAGGTITGVARRADGTPIAGARLSLTSRSVGFINTASDHDGRFRFDAIPTGPMRMELEDAGQRAMRYVEVKDGQTVTQDISLFGTGKGEIAGRVTAGKKPIAGARLLIAANHGQQQGLAMYFPVTGEDGSYRISSLPEGSYMVTVMATSASQGVRVSGDDVTKVDLDAGFVMNDGDMAPRPARRPAAPAAPAAPTAPSP